MVETRVRIVKAVFLATGHRTSVTDACEESGILHPDSFFDHLKACLTSSNVQDVLSTVNAGILDLACGEGVVPAECEIAIDMHVDPDYSERHEGCIGYADLPGTDYGMAYISTEILTPPSRFTLAFSPVRAATNQEGVLEQQLDEAMKRTRITLALLDRGFQRVYVFLALLKRGLQFVVPVICNERVNRIEEEAWRKRTRIPNTPHSYYVVPEYVMQEQARPKRTATVQLVYFFEPDPKNPEKDKCFTFATNPGPLTARDTLRLANKYRTRFGIEAGYREKNELRVRTASDHYGTRLFLQLTSILAYNVWTLLRATRARDTGRTTPARRDALHLRRFKRSLIHLFTPVVAA